MLRFGFFVIKAKEVILSHSTGANFRRFAMRNLVIKARGCEEARLKVLKSFEPLIKKCLKVYVRDYNYYEDAMQHGYMVILKCIRMYDENQGSYFEAYVKRSLMYAMMDYMGKNKSDDLSLDENTEGGAPFVELLQGDEDIEGDIVKREENEELKRALNKLSKEHRRLIEDVYFKGMSMVDVCKGRRCHYMSVVKMKDRALRNLRRELEAL